ncbi:MAG TPA: hypothetical protein VL172_13950 [Kofleriaceae bacterium]|jgi:hypothetical protein|nr:hypothetical protein [Kofleriaceae bacterium]
MAPDDDREPTLDSEEIERRREPRGFVHGMRVTVAGQELEVLEASRKGLFVRLDDPDVFRLGDRQDIQVTAQGGATFSARAEVVRKEIEPRRGAVLRIVHMSPVAEETFKKILDET